MLKTFWRKSDVWTFTKVLTQLYFQSKLFSKTVIAMKMDYSCCFSLGESRFSRFPPNLDYTPISQSYTQMWSPFSLQTHEIPCIWEMALRGFWSSTLITWQKFAFFYYVGKDLSISIGIWAYPMRCYFILNVIINFRDKSSTWNIIINLLKYFIKR